MLQHLPDVDRTVQGLGVLIGTQKPFVRFLMKNWPLVAVAGLAMYSRGRERYQKGELTTYNVLADVGLVISPLVGLALLNQLAAQDQERANQLAVQPSTPAAVTAAAQG